MNDEQSLRGYPSFILSAFIICPSFMLDDEADNAGEIFHFHPAYD
jgi:hypothetical protein